MRTTWSVRTTFGAPGRSPNFDEGRLFGRFSLDRRIRLNRIGCSSRRKLYGYRNRCLC
jgi:hypothetical protein